MIDKIQRLRTITQEQGIIGGLQAIQRFFRYRIKKIIGLKSSNPILRWKFERQYGRGLDVVQQDWDNLIILDACRYDTFEEHTRFEGKLQRVVSVGNCSWSFQRANFAGRNLQDCIYVTANPFSPRISSDVFFKLISLLGEWNEDEGTVLPERVTDATLKAQRMYPNKRLIVHYMQPHAPHIGDYELGFDQRGWDSMSKKKESYSIWEAVKSEYITHEELLTSYTANLTFVESEVETLVKELPGKTVISADHGENLGERVLGLRVYGHGHDTPECLFVPWLELDYESRKEVIASEPVSDVRPGDSTIDDRLRDLGYL
jgi:hypothetical protein